VRRKSEADIVEAIMDLVEDTTVHLPDAMQIRILAAVHDLVCGRLDDLEDEILQEQMTLDRKREEYNSH
jgi:hypothetical protein